MSAMKHILSCLECGQYTLKDKCGCGSRTAASKPAKFSSEDAYGEYRRKAKRGIFIEKGLI